MSTAKYFRAAILSLALSVPTTAFAAEKFAADAGHTEIRVSWSHAGVSIQTAEFEKVDAILTLDEANVESSAIDVTVDVNSLSSGYEALDTHLKSADFLDVEKYPQATFKSTSIKKTGDKTADIAGEFTLHGVSKPITLTATLTHIGDHPVGKFLDYYKGKWVAFTATTVLDHQAFGVGGYSTGPITVEIVSEMKEAN